MKKQKYMLGGIAFLFLILLVMPTVFGGGFKVYSGDLGNGVTRLYGRIMYDAQDPDNLVRRGRAWQTYIIYGLQPIFEWNTENPFNQIDWCSFSVKERHYIWDRRGRTENYTITWHNETFTQDNYSVTRDGYRYFISLKDWDRAEIFFDCHFIDNQSFQSSTIPASFSIASPTWECKACQYYIYYRKHIDQIVGDAITLNTEQIKLNMRNLVRMNVDIWITIFWIIKIMMVLTVVGLIFLGIYWIYIFVRGLIRKI